jgi:uncharacterized protein (TIGR00106 family)
VIGLGRSDPSASEYIAEIQRRLADQDKVGNRLQAMGTELLGSTEDILAVVAELHRVPFELGLPRVYTVLKLDERRDKSRRSMTRCAQWRSGSRRSSAGGGIRTHTSPRGQSGLSRSRLAWFRHPGAH